MGKRILCVLSQVLGNRTYSDLLVERLKKIDGLHVNCFYLSGEDYTKYPSAKILRYSDTLEAAAVLRKKIAAEGIPEHDGIVFNGLGMAMQILPDLKRKPTAVATDTTPRLMRDQQLGLKPGLGRSLLLRASGVLQDLQLKRIAGRVDAFLPMSSWCRDSLVEDYDVAANRCYITMTPKPMAAIRARREAGPLRLLFVGNDFARKGGEQLLKAYRERLSESCVLTIVSNDEGLSRVQLPQGVEWVRGLKGAAEVAPLYPQHDLILYPTRLDQFSHVIAEAAAAGVPAVTSDMGGVKDLVKDGITGLVLPAAAGVDAWAGAIERFARDEVFWRLCADGAYEFAEAKLSIKAFDELLLAVLDRMFLGLR